MDFAHAGLNHEPFSQRGRFFSAFSYKSARAAREFLESAAESPEGIGFLHGPKHSGKRTLIDAFVRSQPADTAVAVVDGSRLNSTELLSAIHSGFRRDLAHDSPDLVLTNIEQFLARETLAGRVPLIVVENLNRMFPSALQALCKLAVLILGGQFVVRIILVSDEPSSNIINAPAMRPVKARLVGVFELGPMMLLETINYVHSALRVAGCEKPALAIPIHICGELHEASQGLPGKLDELATKAIKRAERWPVRSEHVHDSVEQPAETAMPGLSIVREEVDPDTQKLYVTLNGRTMGDFYLDSEKTLIGRSKICDVTINSRFVSKFHALLIRRQDAMLIVDLGSTNGTFVNSTRVECAGLRHDDVISLGSHGVKVVAPAYRAKPALPETSLSDTTTMKTLDDASLVEELDSAAQD